VRTLAMTAPTGQLLSRLAGAWRQVATAREREGSVTAAAAASAAAHTTHRATSSEATFARRDRQPARGISQQRDR
jgi:hypothetical protein